MNIIRFNSQDPQECAWTRSNRKFHRKLRTTGCRRNHKMILNVNRVLNQFITITPTYSLNKNIVFINASGLIVMLLICTVFWMAVSRFITGFSKPYVFLTLNNIPTWSEIRPFHRVITVCLNPDGSLSRLWNKTRRNFLDLNIQGKL